MIWTNLNSKGIALFLLENLLLAELHWIYKAILNDRFAVGTGASCEIKVPYALKL